MKILKLIAIATLMSTTALSHADTTPAPLAFNMDGFVEAYYKFNPDGRKPGATVDKVFDIRQNSFTLGGGRLGAKTTDGHGVIDLYFGDYAQVLAPDPVLVSPTAQVIIGQAFVTAPVGPVTLTLGKYMTHVGFEVVDSVSNWNLSRSLLYNSVPFFHTGIKLNYALMDGLGLMVQLDNGNGKVASSDESTAGGAQLSYTGVKDLAFYLNYYYEPSFATVVWEKTHYIDVVSTYKLMDGLDLGAEYLFKTTIGAGDTDLAGDVISSNFLVDPATGKKLPYSPKMQGYALYANYAVAALPGLSLAPRFEALYMPDSVPAALPIDGMGVTKFDYTLTAKYAQAAVTHWLEARMDVSDDAIYPGPVADALKLDPKPSYSEMALTYGLTVKF